MGLSQTGVELIEAPKFKDRLRNPNLLSSKLVLAISAAETSGFTETRKALVEMLEEIREYPLLVIGNFVLLSATSLDICIQLACFSPRTI